MIGTALDLAKQQENIDDLTNAITEADKMELDDALIQPYRKALFDFQTPRDAGPRRDAGHAEMLDR